MVSVLFDSFQADAVQRPDNFDASISLGGMRVYDGTTPGTLHAQVVRVKGVGASDALSNGHDEVDESAPALADDQAFFFAKFEHNPMDERADSRLTVRMRPMEIFYHRGYVEEIAKFFRPPESQLESVNALLDVATETLEGFRKETRAGLEYALEKHKTVSIATTRSTAHADFTI